MALELTEILAQAGIDYADALNRLDNNAALYRRVVMHYVEDTHLAHLEEALATGDCEAAHYEAHALKGVAGNLSFSTLCTCVTSLDNEVRIGNLDAARALMPATRDAHVAVLRGLEAAFGDGAQ